MANGLGLSALLFVLLPAVAKGLGEAALFAVNGAKGFAERFALALLTAAGVGVPKGLALGAEVEPNGFGFWPMLLGCPNVEDPNGLGFAPIADG